MPRKNGLTWQAGASGREGRWRKKHKGKVYYFAGGRGKTDREAESAALKQWEKLKAKIDGESPKQFQAEYQAAIAKWEQVLLWCRKNNDDSMAETAITKLAVLKNEFSRPKPRILEKADLFEGQFDLGIRSPAYSKMLVEIAEVAFGPPATTTDKSHVVPPEFLIDDLAIEKLVWKDRLAVEQRKEQPVDHSVGTHIDDFLRHKRSAATAGSISLGRIENIRSQLVHFRDWLGAATPVADISSDSLTSYHDYLLQCVQDGKCSPTTASERMGAVKSFVRRLWLLERIPTLPRVLASASQVLGITKSTSQVVTFTPAEIEQILTKAPSRTRLYFLLMLNCGMTQKDISDLSPVEIDLDSGRITRKRSKTRQHTNVPTVSYRLWPETLVLLNEIYRKSTTGRIFLNENGSPLCHDEMAADGKYTRSDNIRSAFERIRMKIGLTKSLKAFRKTSATLLANSKDYRGLEDLFLGHAPRRISEKHYVQSSLNVLDDALEWLRGEYGLAKLAVFKSPKGKTGEGKR